MTIEGLRKRKRRYTNVPAATIEDYGNLDCRDLGLLVRMLSKPDGWRFSAKRLSKEWVRDGETVIGTGLRHLAEAGYYRLERRRTIDGEIKMGNAISEEPVQSWIEDYKAFGGSAVDLVEQKDGTFKVKRPDGSLVSDGFETEHTRTPADDPSPTPESGEFPQVAPDRGFPDPVDPGPEQPGPGGSGSGEPRPSVITEGATTERTTQVELLRSSTCREDRDGSAVSSDTGSPVSAAPEAGAIEGKVLKLPVAGDSATSGKVEDPRAAALELPPEPGAFAPAGERRTREEQDRARDAAHAVAEAWWEHMKAQGTPIVSNESGKPFMALRSAIASRLLGGYGVNEIKNAMVDLYRRRHMTVPSAAALDAELVARRNGHANGAPVPQQRGPGGRLTATERAAKAREIGEKLQAEAAAVGGR
jgi:hypothetical protein